MKTTRINSGVGAVIIAFSLLMAWRGLRTATAQEIEYATFQVEEINPGHWRKLISERTSARNQVFWARSGTPSQKSTYFTSRSAQSKRKNLVSPRPAGLRYDQWLPLVISPPSVFAPPDEIGVEIYRLTASGARREPLTMCAEGDTAWGCTAFCNESGFSCPLDHVFVYPYPTGTITVAMQTDYLLDVVPREMGSWYDSVALEAQAVTARTFAYYYAHNPPTLIPFNNSASFQAFIPRSFERVFPTKFPSDDDMQWDDPCGAAYDQLNPGQREVCDAVALPHYLSYQDETPIRSRFSADVFEYTTDGTEAYHVSVPDPISTACDAEDFGHGVGMSQEGASRWARGHECSYAGAPVKGDNDPGGPWRLTWNRDQILTHYYTGVHLRGQNRNRLTPDYRWNPLDVFWGTPENQLPSLTYPKSYPFEMRIQNTGTVTWMTGMVGVVQRWTNGEGVYQSAASKEMSLAPGETLITPITLTTQILPGAGMYTLSVDLAVQDAVGTWVPFGELEPGLPWFPFEMSFQVDEQ